MRHLVLLVPLLAATLLGCTGARRTLHTQQHTLDSLRSAHAALQDRAALLADSLRFYESIESGRFYRQVRVLHDRIAQLTYELSILRDGGITVSTLQADALFEPASATLRAHGTKELAALAKHIQQAYPDRRLRIEGHADNVPLAEPLQEKYPSNWELSAARAAAVARHLIHEYDMAPNRFVVVGYGSTQPTASNETAAGRWLNRRVRIAVLPEPYPFERPFTLSW